MMGGCATSMPDTQLDFSDEIYRRENDGPVLEWRRSLGNDAPEFNGREPPFCPAETVPTQASWQDNLHITLQLKSLGFHDCREKVWPASIELAPGGWRVVTGSPRDG